MLFHKYLNIYFPWNLLPMIGRCSLLPQIVVFTPQRRFLSCGEIGLISPPPKEYLSLVSSGCLSCGIIPLHEQVRIWVLLCHRCKLGDGKLNLIHVSNRQSNSEISRFLSGLFLKMWKIIKDLGYG